MTVGVPIYRGKQFLEESLLSVQRQTYQDIQVILSLDGPDRECEEICRRFLSDSRFRLIVQPQRLGWMDHTNWLMAQIETEFWHIQEQDDIIEPLFLATLVAHANAHSNVAAAYFDVQTFGNFEVLIAMSSVVGSPMVRQLKLIYEHFQGVAPLGVIRTEALRMSGGLCPNAFDNFAADTALMSGLARWGELHRVTGLPYQKRIHADNTHATWWTWSAERRSAAWQAHCLDMLTEALKIDTGPQERRLLWLATIERLLSSRAINLLPVVELSAAGRSVMLDAFLQRARNSSTDIAAALGASWNEIDRWTRPFVWTGTPSVNADQVS